MLGTSAFGPKPEWADSFRHIRSWGDSGPAGDVVGGSAVDLYRPSLQVLGYERRGVRKERMPLGVAQHAFGAIVLRRRARQPSGGPAQVALTSSMATRSSRLGLTGPAPSSPFPVMAVFAPSKA